MQVVTIRSMTAWPIRAALSLPQLVRGHSRQGLTSLVRGNGKMRPRLALENELRMHKVQFL